MNKLLLATAAMMFIAAPAFAEDEAPQVSVTTNIAQVCKVVHSPNTIKVKTQVDHNGANIGTIKLGAEGGPKDVEVFCNTPGSKLQISREKLQGVNTVSESSAANGFTNVIDFNAALHGAWENDVNGWWDTDGIHTPGGIWDYGVYHSTLQLSVDNVHLDDGALYPVDGNYAGSITITMTPGV